MAKKKQTKRSLVDEFNKEIDKKIQKGIPSENLPSKISDREYKNLSFTEARRLERAIKTEDFRTQLYHSEKDDNIALTSGMQAVDRIRMTAQNRIQKEKRERIKTLPTYEEQDIYSRRSLESRGDLIDLTEGSDTLSPRDKAKRIRSHETFYEKSGGENLKRVLISAIENQNALIDLSDYISWIQGVDAEIIEDVYYSDVDFDVKEFYMSQFTDEFVSMLNVFKEKFQSTAQKNKKVYSKAQLKTVENEGKFYTYSNKEGETLGIVYRNKMNKTKTGYIMQDGKRKRIYYEESI